jgi:prevent-host-death family protein
MPRSIARTLNLNVDLQNGVVPISKAASALAALIKRGKEYQQPIIVTQKGYPTGVLLPIDLYSKLRVLAQQEIGVATDLSGELHVPSALDDASDVKQVVAALPDPAAVVAPDDPANEALDAEAPGDDAPVRRRARGGRRAKAAE